MVRLSHVHLPVPNLARSLAFYTDQLGPDVGYTFAFAAKGRLSVGQVQT